MRKMIRWTAFVMVLAMTALLLCSCGGGELVGTWESVSLESLSLPAAQYDENYISSSVQTPDVTLVLKSDGSFTLIGDTEEAEGTYTVEENRLILTASYPEHEVVELEIQEKDGVFRLSLNQMLFFYREEDLSSILH